MYHIEILYFRSRIFIHPEHFNLSATLDCLIRNYGILEIKSPASVEYVTQMKQLKIIKKKTFWK